MKPLVWFPMFSLLILLGPALALAEVAPPELHEPYPSPGLVDRYDLQNQLDPANGLRQGYGVVRGLRGWGEYTRPGSDSPGTTCAAGDGTCLAKFWNDGLSVAGVDLNLLFSPELPRLRGPMRLATEGQASWTEGDLVELSRELQAEPQVGSLRSSLGGSLRTGLVGLGYSEPQLRTLFVRALSFAVVGYAWALRDDADPSIRQAARAVLLVDVGYSGGAGSYGMARYCGRFPGQESCAALGRAQADMLGAFLRLRAVHARTTATRALVEPRESRSAEGMFGLGFGDLVRP